MRNELTRELNRAMNKLRFSPESKIRITENILQCADQEKKGRNNIMRKWTFTKAAAVAASCLIFTGGSVFAASRIVSYTASSNSSYDFVSIDELNDAAEGIVDGESPAAPKLSEALGDFRFSGGNLVNVAGKDDGGNTLGKWNELNAEYKNDDGIRLNLNLSAYVADGEERTPTIERSIGGITVDYNLDEYLFLPAEDKPLAPAIAERQASDDHFFVSYGSNEEESLFYSGVSFVKDGIRYYLYTSDRISADELFNAAEELIER